MFHAATECFASFWNIYKRQDQKVIFYFGTDSLQKTKKKEKMKRKETSQFHVQR